MLKTPLGYVVQPDPAYHLGEGRVLKTIIDYDGDADKAYHLGEGRVLKTERRVHVVAD